MALVTLVTAKQHLRIVDTDHDADIVVKLAQAEAIILNYLKTQITSIASISAANPAVVTTATAHGLTSGVTYTISGTTTTPTIEGARVVTVISPTTFSVPVDVTIGESESEGIVSTAAYTDITVPGSISAAVLLMLARLYEQRGDDEEADEALWAAIDRLLKRHRDPALA